MRNIIGWLSAAIAGAVGWWLGAYVNLAVAVILSAITGAVGLYYGYRWFDQNLS
jgi:membrane protein implicated in regulation of membrane protease activity